MDCINLAEKFGNLYRIATEESYTAERGENGRGKAARQVARLPGVVVTQDGSDGFNLAFAPELFPAVAALVKPKRRRKLTAEAKTRFVAVGAVYRFKPGHGAGASFAERQRVRND